MKFFLIALCLLSFNLQAEECSDLKKCVESVSKLTGKKYMYDKEFKGGLQSSSNLEITAENAEVLFTSILEINGYGRVPTGVKDTYKIVALRDIRYEAVPMVSSDAQTAPAIPANSDYYLMNYKFTNYSQFQLRNSANSLRPYMSRFGRIIESKGTGVLTVHESGIKMHQIYEILKLQDRPYTKDEMIAFEKEEMKREERERNEAKNEKPIKNKK